MRQSGILAQACHYALDNNIERLAEDHLLASRVGAVIEKKPGLTLSFPVETNIVIFRVEDESIDFEKFTKDLETDLSGSLLISMYRQMISIILKV